MRYLLRMTRLAKKHCQPCRGGVPPLSAEEIKPLARELPDWQIIENHHLQRSYTFPDFQSALDFTNRVGAVAEQEDHHPDILLSWGKVALTIWTHKVNGLTENDFILAAKADEQYQPERVAK